MLQASAISPRFLPDDRLLAECRTDLTRGSGPGGQKRNKTSNCVRLTHRPTGLHVTAGESRSLLENKTRALRRMRLKLAVEVREPVDLLTFAPPAWALSVRRERRLEISARHPFYAPLVGLALDLMLALKGNPTAVAINLGVSTTAVLKLLASDAHAWAAANAIRAGWGAGPLVKRH